MLNPAGLLQQHLIKQFLTQLNLHLPPDAENQLTGDEPHHAHACGEQHDPARLSQHVAVSETLLEVIDHPAHFERNRDAEHIHHDQCDRAHQHRASMGLQVAADQIEAEGGHREP